MKYFAALAPMKDAQKSKEYRQQHLDFLKEQREAGHVFMYGRFADGTGGLVIYRGESFETVEEIVRQDPYVTSGARHYEVHEWDMQTDYTIQS